MKKMISEIYGKYFPRPYYTVPSFLQSDEPSKCQLLAPNSMFWEQQRKLGIDPHKTRSVICYNHDYSGKIRSIETPFDEEQIRQIKQYSDIFFGSLDFNFLTKVREEVKKRETYRIPQITFLMKLYNKPIFTKEGVGICYYDLKITINANDGQIMNIQEL